MRRSTDRSEQVQLLRSGDAVSWEGLYTRMYQSMVSYASRRLPAEEARDAVSESMARALARPGGLPRDAAPEAWVFGILRHVVRDAQRRSSRGVSALHRSAAASVDWTGVDDGLISDEEESGVRDAFEQLSARDQEVLELRVVAGLSAQDAGRVLGMREGAVRNAQLRALRRLRALFDDDLDGERQEARI
ncbi:MAG: RNA polymerase sigma factor [Acidimicrobiales bacterium]